MTDELTSRQRRLTQVGDAGQRRIDASSAQVAAGPSAATEMAYLVRAGVEKLRVDRAPDATFSHATTFSFSGPLQVALGAHRALGHLRRILAG